MPSLLLRHNVSVPDLQTYYTELWSGGQASFSSSQTRGWLTDLELVGETEIGWGSIMVHKAVVLTLCPSLAYVLYEVEESKVIFTDVPLEVIKSVVELIYTGECSLPAMANVKAILDLAKSLGLHIQPDRLQVNQAKQENIVNVTKSKQQVSLVTETIEHVVSLARSFAVETKEESKKDINSNDVISVEKRKSVKPRFFCEHCKFECRFWIQLVEHSNIVHPNKQFQCKKCDFKTSKLINLKQHDRTVHVGKGSFKCDVCGFKATSSLKLVWHQSYQHKMGVMKQLVKEKKKTSQQTLLSQKVVRKVPRGKIPPQVEKLHCHVCQFQTFYKKSLRKHVVRFHEQEDV